MSNEQTDVAVVKSERRSIIASMAEQCSMDPVAFQRTLMETVMPKNAKAEDVAAFLVVCNEYHLNPFTRTVFAFSAQGGGIRPIVSIDGWYTIANQHPQYDGIETEDLFDKSGAFYAVRASVHRKDRGHPIVLTEHLDECRRDTDPWKRWPKRMLRHKASIQALRAAFGFAGIYDEDEAERIVEAETVSQRPAPAKSLDAAAERIAARSAKEREEEIVVEADPAPAKPDTKNKTVTQPVFGIPVLTSLVEDRSRWWEEPIVKNADSKSPLKGHSWKTATLGSKDGGRHAMLNLMVSGARDRWTQSKMMPATNEMKAALALQALQNRLEDEEIARAEHGGDAEEMRSWLGDKPADPADVKR